MGPVRGFSIDVSCSYTNWGWLKNECVVSIKKLLPWIQNWRYKCFKVDTKYEEQNKKLIESWTFSKILDMKLNQKINHKKCTFKSNNGYKKKKINWLLWWLSIGGLRA